MTLEPEMKIETIDRVATPKLDVGIRAGSSASLQKINHRQKRRPEDRDAYRSNWSAVFVAQCEVCGASYRKSEPHVCSTERS